MSDSENNNSDAPANDWKQREVGALWKRQSTSQKYLSGKVKIGGEEVGIVVFTNRYKEEGSKQPDFRVYLERKREEEPATVSAEASQEEEDLL